MDEPIHPNDKSTKHDDSGSDITIIDEPKKKADVKEKQETGETTLKSPSRRESGKNMYSV